MAFGGLEEFGALFAPGMRHEQEEKNRLELWREDAEDGAPPRSVIDLDNGIAVIRLPAKAEDAEGGTVGGETDRPGS
jgi:uncharacterized protein DUF6191